MVFGVVHRVGYGVVYGVGFQLRIQGSGALRRLRWGVCLLASCSTAPVPSGLPGGIHAYESVCDALYTTCVSHAHRGKSHIHS